MATDTWNDGSDNWNTPADWSSGLPGSSIGVVIDEGNPQVTASFGTISTLSVGATLTLINAGASKVTNGVTNIGTISLDPFTNNGGSSLTIGGALSNSGTLSIGPGNNTLSAASTVKVASVTNVVGTTRGTINIVGSSTAEATLSVTSAAGLGAAGGLYGNVNLSGGALLEFASGQITSIATQSELSLSGPRAYVADAGSLGSNSALKGLKTVTGGLYLYNGASVTTGALTNTGTISLDQYSGNGGALLTIGGALSNSGTLSIGPGNNTLSAASTVKVASVTDAFGATLGTIDITGSSTAKAALNITSAAGLGVAGGIYGNVNLSGGALLEFASGQITSIATQSELSLSGPKAYVADAGSLGSNSALKGLKTVTGGLYLYNGASVTTGALTNTGTVSLDQYTGNGGATLTIRGTLANTGTIQVGPGNDSLTSATTISAATIANYKGPAFGTINVSGNDSPSLIVPIPAALELSGAAGFGIAGAVEGNVNVSYAGQIVFGRGQISAIAAQSELSLADPDAVVADKSDTSTNSALRGLKSVVGGLYLYNGASVTTGALINSGTIRLDQYTDNGGSSLTVDGKLTNTGTLAIGPGNDTLTSASTVSAASVLNFSGSTFGTIDVYGNDSASIIIPVPAELDISGSAGFGAGGTLYGNVNVAYDGEIVFGGGQIKTIAANSELSLSDHDAVVADSSNTSSNSALKGLAENDGGLYLYDGSVVTASGSLSNAGTISLDQYTNNGGSSLTVDSELTNTGTITIGSGNNTLSVADWVRAATLNNQGTIDVYGNLANAINANLSVTGAFTNDGEIGFSDASAKIVGAVSGTGDISLSNGSHLQLVGSVSNGETITFGSGAADVLTLLGGSSFHGTIDNFFTSGDNVDLSNFAYASTKILYTQTGTDSASVTLTDGANHAVINFAGEQYTKSEFSIVSANSGSGTEIKFV